MKISTTVIELEDPGILRKFFKIQKDEIQYATIITTARMEEILKKLPSSKTQITKIPDTVTTLGKMAKCDRTREFLYPTEYSPPTINNTRNSAGDSKTVFPVTPATPANFETKILGLSCEFTPSLVSNSTYLDLEIAIDHSHFLGFVNYGSPIMAPATNAFGFSTPIVITENRIEMPIFRTHRFHTSYRIPPGHVIALIGSSMESQESMDQQTRFPKTGDSRKLTPAKSILYLIQSEIL